MTLRSSKKEVTKAVKLSKLQTAKNLTLTGSPANEVAFKVVRKDETGAPVAKITCQRPVRRMAPSLTLLFPETTGEEDIAAYMTDFGIADYKLGDVVEGRRVVKASDDAEMPQTYVTVNLRDGIKALVAQGAAVPSDTDPKPNVAVVEINFKKENFASDAEVRAWAAERGIDISESEIDNGDESVIVRRSEVEEGAEVKQIPVGDGVFAVVTRAEVQDIPPALLEVVSEAAYGNWGWGQLDFAARMADVEFSEVAREALNVLDSVVRDILFWSPLPLAVRKELVARASSQFAAFIGALLDALPARVVISYRSDKENDMKVDAKAEAQRLLAEQATVKAEQKKRADTEREYLKDKVEKPEELAAMADTEVIAVADELRKRLDAAAAEAKKAEPVTRAEVETLVTTAVTAGVTAALQAAGVKRSEPTAAELEAERVRKEEEQRQRSSTEMATAIARAVRSEMEPIAKTVTEMGSKVEALASATVVRSDDADGKGTTQKPDVFAGMFKGTAKT